MAKPELVTEIENRSNKNIRISDELADVLVYTCANGHVDQGSAITTKQLTKRCTEAKYSRLRRLERLGFLDGYKKGADHFIIHEPTGDYLDRNTFEPRLNAEIRRVQVHINHNSTIKRIAAGELRCSPSRVTAELSNGGVWERRQKLEKVVDGIQATPGVSTAGYGKIIVRSNKKFWYATSRTVSLFNI